MSRHQLKASDKSYQDMVISLEILVYKDINRLNCTQLKDEICRV